MPHGQLGDSCEPACYLDMKLSCGLPIMNNFCGWFSSKRVQWPCYECISRCFKLEPVVNACADAAAVWSSIPLYRVEATCVTFDTQASCGAGGLCCVPALCNKQLRTCRVALRTVHVWKHGSFLITCLSDSNGSVWILVLLE